MGFVRGVAELGGGRERERERERGSERGRERDREIERKREREREREVAAAFQSDAASSTTDSSAIIPGPRISALGERLELGIMPVAARIGSYTYPVMNNRSPWPL
jgi:hypothetical protein